MFDSGFNVIYANSADVSDDVVNGYYTTPEIEKESILTINYQDAYTATMFSISEVHLALLTNQALFDDIFTNTHIKYI